MTPNPTSCAFCHQTFRKKDDVWVLDAEWLRRFPRLSSRLACTSCALLDRWFACGPNDPGHIPDPERCPIGDGDSWSHITCRGPRDRVLRWLEKQPA